MNILIIIKEEEAQVLIPELTEVFTDGLTPFTIVFAESLQGLIGFHFDQIVISKAVTFNAAQEVIIEEILSRSLVTKEFRIQVYG